MKNIIRGSTERVYSKGCLTYEYDASFRKEEADGAVSDRSFDILLQYHGGEKAGYDAWAGFIKRNSSYYGEKDLPADGNAMEIYRNIPDRRTREDFLRRCIRTGLSPEISAGEAAAGAPYEKRIDAVREFLRSEYNRWKEFSAGGAGILVLYERNETRAEIPLMLRSYDVVVTYLFSEICVYGGDRRMIRRLHEWFSSKEPHWRMRRLPENLPYAAFHSDGKRTALKIKEESFWENTPLPGGDAQ